jgi:hypothetical protein
MRKGVSPRIGAWMPASCLTIAAFGLTVLMLTITAAAAEISPLPIPQQPHAQPVPSFVGQPAIPMPISTSPIPPHPFMAPNGRSNIHLDAYMSDTYETAEPLGRSPEVRSALLLAECGSMTFDRAGRIITFCPGPRGPRLLLLDPVTLATEATLRLPPRHASLGFGAGIYLFLDQLDQAVIPTHTRQIWIVAEVEGPHGPRFELVPRYDLSPVVPEEDTIVSALPDAQGLLWFVTAGGIVGTLEPDQGTLASLRLEGERISKSLAVDPVAERGGVFIVSDYALYRFDASPDGAPAITWRESYDRGSRLKPGQLQVGSGTTPTLMGSQFVAITDNAEPQMHVLVYRRAPEVEGSRPICAEPVFEPGMSATENSLIATDRSIIVENNYGYTGPEATVFGRTTAPGIARIDLDDEGGCHTVRTSQERVPSVVSQRSLATGLVYTSTKDPRPATTDAWYFTAINFHPGATVFKQLAGTGILYNNDYAGLYLGPDGTAYVGVLGGLVAIRDSE